MFRPVIQCPECGEDTPAWARGGYRSFCSPACRLAFNNRTKAEGALIVTLAKVWRRNRGKGETAKEAFSEMVRILDALNARDIEEGRPNPTDHVTRQLQFGLRYQDRRRR